MIHFFFGSLVYKDWFESTHIAIEYYEWFDNLIVNNGKSSLIYEFYNSGVFFSKNVTIIGFFDKFCSSKNLDNSDTGIIIGKVLL